ncbi:MAG: bi-domain-containing oxidoreductase [Pseudomonadota bacterium]
MKIALQRLKDGDVRSFDLPAPVCGDGEILVATKYSVISTGTELSRLQAAKSSLLGKALRRPEELKKVLTAIKRKGFATTYTKVTNRLEQYNKIGYSSAGIVAAKGRLVTHVDVGDQVAMAGSGFAIHSSYTVVPKNLCVKVPRDVPLDAAAFATIGSIALQGLRRLDPELGETVVVIGLGLLGQIAVQLLRANGVRVIGVDRQQARLKVAEGLGCPHTFLPDDPRLPELIDEVTHGYGADGVIITASTKSTDPINLAGKLARKRGRVVIVGDIGHDFERSNYYEKELTLLMSCSYGAGRYDKDYEVEGIDYPQAYVPWTIARNMEAYLHLAATGQVNINTLISHVFSIDEAPAAYQKLLDNKADTFSILFKYAHEQESGNIHTVRIPEPAPAGVGGTRVGIIGVGSYAKSFILPNIDSRLTVYGISAKSPSSLVVRGLRGCRVTTTDPQVLLREKEIQTIIVATRHSTHAQLAVDAIRNGKNVYVEKPAAINRRQLDEIAAALSEHGGNLCVGFNRRYAGAIAAVQKCKSRGPLESKYTIIADEFPEDYWALQDQEGGIIVGEMIHFVDLLSCLHQSPIVRVHASANLKAINRGVIYASLFFENRTMANITYLMGIPIKASKESIELYYDDDRIVIDGFKEARTSQGKSVYKSGKTDMGRERLFGEILHQFTAGKAVQDVPGILSSHAAAFAIRESVNSGAIIEVDRFA